MRFKVDENLPVDVAAVLRDVTDDVHTVIDENLSGASDTRLSEICKAEKRILVTLDGDFGDIRAYPPAEYPGIIILRPRTQAIVDILALVKRILPIIREEPIVGHLWIATEDRIRIRGE